MPLTTPPRIRLPHGCTPKKLALPSTLPIGLLAYYKLDDASGSSAADATGNGNTGTWNGTLGSQWGTGKIGGDGVFNGTDNYIDCGRALIPLLGTTSGLSAAGWINPTNGAGSYHWLGNSAPSSGSSPWQNNGFLLSTGSSSIQFWVGNGTTFAEAITQATLSASWHHFACTFDNNHLVTYIDGAAGTPTPLAGPMADSGNLNQSVRLGLPYQVGSPLAGSLDEVGFWNRALTPQEIAALYNGGVGTQFPFPGA